MANVSNLLSSDVNQRTRSSPPPCRQPFKGRYRVYGPSRSLSRTTTNRNQVFKLPLMINFTYGHSSTSGRRYNLSLFLTFFVRSILGTMRGVLIQPTPRPTMVGRDIRTRISSNKEAVKFTLRRPISCFTLELDYNLRPAAG